MTLLQEKPKFASVMDGDDKSSHYLAPNNVASPHGGVAEASSASGNPGLGLIGNSMEDEGKEVQH